jgi:hypothetical protein
MVDEIRALTTESECNNDDCLEILFDQKVEVDPIVKTKKSDNYDRLLCTSPLPTYPPAGVCSPSA